MDLAKLIASLDVASLEHEEVWAHQVRVSKHVGPGAVYRQWDTNGRLTLWISEAGWTSMALRREPAVPDPYVGGSGFVWGVPVIVDEA